MLEWFVFSSRPIIPFSMVRCSENFSKFSHIAKWGKVGPKWCNCTLSWPHKLFTFPWSTPTSGQKSTRMSTIGLPWLILMRSSGLQRSLVAGLTPRKHFIFGRYGESRCGGDENQHRNVCVRVSNRSCLPFWCVVSRSPLRGLLQFLKLWI
jgi:hypothetical protein